MEPWGVAVLKQLVWALSFSLVMAFVKPGMAFRFQRFNPRAFGQTFFIAFPIALLCEFFVWRGH